MISEVRGQNSEVRGTMREIWTKASLPKVCYNGSPSTMIAKTANVDHLSRIEMKGGRGKTCASRSFVF